MLSKDVALLTPIPAADDSRLREILHPERDAVDIRYSLAHAVIHGGEASRRHRLASVEVYYFLAGTGVVHVGEESETVGPGRTIVIPAGVTQWVRNTGDHDLELLCIVDPAWREEDEEVLA
ncbi:MAG: cupin domain-containing protein [Candidatus Eisenbacteria sp.]|nr:cupin domain-containing protein [Candidatus Eisenbacteria bacterium]